LASAIQPESDSKNSAFEEFGKQKWQGMQVLSMIESKAPFFWQVFFWDSKREKHLPIFA